MTTFRFIAFRDFKRTLGKMNAAVECAELAMRRLLRDVEQSNNRAEFVQAVSKEFNVRVDSLDASLLKGLIAQFHIATVHQEFEGFLTSLARELRGKAIKPDEGDSLLKGTLKQLLGGFEEGQNKIGRFEVEIAEYYRLVRNGFAHDGADGAVKKNVTRLRSLVKEQGVTFSRMNSPNTFESVEFDDFILFTRVVKKLAEKLSQAVRPSDADIVEMVRKHNENGAHNVNFKKFHHLKQNSERLERAISSLLRTLYGLDPNESAPIVRSLMAGLLA
jgi:hypothetical protein